MADEKLNTSPEENPQPSLFDTGPAEAPTPEPPAPEKAPEQAAGEPPAQDAPAGAPGEVKLTADQIEKLMAERRAAERAEVEKNEPPEPEQPPTPAPEEKAAGEKGPAKKDKQTSFPLVPWGNAERQHPNKCCPSTLPLDLPHETAVIVREPGADYPLKNRKSTFYICRGHSCMPPVNELPGL